MISAQKLEQPLQEFRDRIAANSVEARELARGARRQADKLSG